MVNVTQSAQKRKRGRPLGSPNRKTKRSSALQRLEDRLRPANRKIDRRRGDPTKVGAGNSPYQRARQALLTPKQLHGNANPANRLSSETLCPLLHLVRRGTDPAFASVHTRVTIGGKRLELGSLGFRLPVVYWNRETQRVNAGCHWPECLKFFRANGPKSLFFLLKIFETMQTYNNPGTGRKATLPDSARYGRTVPLADIMADILAGIAPAPRDTKPVTPKLRPPVPPPGRRPPRKRTEA
ncbi:MAG: hypothetical protein LH606_08510 [Cytophagaceae bacterium]|nr:hypothetical protein [Cytophagaceae bacterium]